MHPIHTLHRFEGDWLGEMIYPRKTAQYRMTALVALDGRAVIANDEQLENGLITFRAHKVFGYHDYQKIFTYYFFDSDGATPLTCAQGNWQGEALVLEQQTPFGRVRYTYAFEGEDQFEYLMGVSEDGENWERYQRGLFRRAESVPN